MSSSSCPAKRSSGLACNNKSRGDFGIYCGRHKHIYYEQKLREQRRREQEDLLRRVELERQANQRREAERQANQRREDELKRQNANRNAAMQQFLLKQRQEQQLMINRRQQEQADFQLACRLYETDRQAIVGAINAGAQALQRQQQQIQQLQQRQDESDKRHEQTETQLSLIGQLYRTIGDSSKRTCVKVLNWAGIRSQRHEQSLLATREASEQKRDQARLALLP